jgi:small-conductance mechanosensitive channel
MSEPRNNRLSNEYPSMTMPSEAKVIAGEKEPWWQEEINQLFDENQRLKDDINTHEYAANELAHRNAKLVGEVERLQAYSRQADEATALVYGRLDKAQAEIERLRAELTKIRDKFDATYAGLQHIARLALEKDAE